jgi:hypothetical protein
MSESGVVGINAATEHAYQSGTLSTGRRILAIIEQLMDGAEGPSLTYADLTWLRANVLDTIDVAKFALSAERRSPESPGAPRQGS